MLPSCKTYIRCLFCVTGKEEHVAARICEAGLGNAFHPQKKKPFFKNGEWEDRQVSLLPGYVFVAADTPVPLSVFCQISGVIRPLTYGPDDHEGYLTGNDLGLAVWLMQEKGIVDKLDAVEEGGRIRIVDGLLKDINGKVLHVDRRKRLAHVELEIVGNIHGVWLGLNFLERAENSV